MQRPSERLPVVVQVPGQTDEPVPPVLLLVALAARSRVAKADAALTNYRRRRASRTACSSRTSISLGLRTRPDSDEKNETNSECSERASHLEHLRVRILGLPARGRARKFGRLTTRARVQAVRAPGAAAAALAATTVRARRARVRVRETGIAALRVGAVARASRRRAEARSGGG